MKSLCPNSEAVYLPKWPSEAPKGHLFAGFARQRTKHEPSIKTEQILYDTIASQDEKHCRSRESLLRNATNDALIVIKILVFHGNCFRGTSGAQKTSVYTPLSYWKLLNPHYHFVYIENNLKPIIGILPLKSSAEFSMRDKFNLKGRQKCVPDYASFEVKQKKREIISKWEQNVLYKKYEGILMVILINYYIVPSQEINWRGHPSLYRLFLTSCLLLQEKNLFSTTMH